MISSRPAAGFATLTVTLLVVVFVTALCLMSGKMLVAEQRLAANEMRYREAMASAQAGLDAALAEISNAIQTEGSSTAALAAIASAGLSTSGVTVATSTITVGSDTLPLVTLTASGSSADGEGEATVREQAIITSVLAAAPDSPLTVAGGLPVSGNFQVVANPNGGGPGVPLSVWTDGNVDLSTGSGDTCGLQEWQDGTCASSPYSSSKTGKQSDILDSDSNFPSDLLDYIFGVPDTTAGMATLEGRAKAILSGCGSLGPTSTGFYIVDGDCTPSGTLGSAAAPVVVLVRDGDVTLGANINIYGVLFAYDSDPDDVTDFDLNMNGTASVNGALVANYSPGKANGTYNAVFDATAMANVQSGPAFAVVARVPGSWRDW